MKYELIDMCSETAVIKVIGVGGGGGNAVNHMVGCHIEGVEFICANTDAQALRKLNIGTIIQLGVELTKGLGAGTNPEVGKQAAEENRERIKEVIQGADMIFLTAGMGGGTGTGAIPVIAEIAREMGMLTVAVVTKPFLFEGKRKQAIAEQGIAELEKYVDSLITIPNQKLLPVLGNSVSLMNAFKAANDVLLDAVQGITDLIVHPGMINVDFADVRTVMSGMGAAIMGTGSASGEHRAREAAEQAIACPLLEDINLQGARGILVNISAADMGIAEFNEVGTIVHEFASEDAIIKIGTAIDPALGDEIKVTVVATGMGAPAAVPKAAVKVMPVMPVGHPNYEGLDKPTVIRNKGENKETRFGAQPKKDADLNYLDIPAFLRRQAD
ncbi:GTP-binding tubulin-like cell division protein [Candidatus Methylobacter favarea]|uniref:Cell division protein FtsZ n=1 Tax=Candidatus Methylobacter favarea TaxID=2707345 RepID=A0A8S0X7H5_9GAMM|nr:cell division protein FtsZ [Candidatus Methylobacter favarea]CAA9890047.1 GTP-binding tubulin-like cell division protein [Candidatus Methylobacter favarea]